MRFDPERCVECGKPCTPAITIGGFGFCSEEHYADAYSKYVDRRYAVDKEPWEIDPDAKALWKEMEAFEVTPFTELLKRFDSLEDAMTHNAATDKKLEAACDHWWAIQDQEIEQAKAKLHDRIYREWENYEREQRNKEAAEREKQHERQEREQQREEERKRREEQREQERTERREREEQREEEKRDREEQKDFEREEEEARWRPRPFTIL